MTTRHPTLAWPIIILAFASIASARARADAAFAPQDVVDAYPLPTGSAPLPRNGRVAFFGAPVADISFVRTRADGTELVLDHEQVPSANEGIYLVNPGALTAGEPLVITSRCAAGCGFVAAWEVDSLVDETPPVIADEDVATEVFVFRSAFNLEAESFNVSISLPVISDDAAPVLVLVTGEGVGTRVIASAGARAQASLFSPGSDRRTECYRVRAIDAAGNETVRAGEVCVDLDPTAGQQQGCASTRTAAPLSLLSLLSLLPLLNRVRTGRTGRSRARRSP